MRFNKWCFHWLEVYKKRFIKNSTYESYLYACQHITCRKKLKKIQISDLQKVINKMIDKGLARSTIKHTVTIMVQAVRRASALGYSESMDFATLELPKDLKPKVRALARSEQATMLKTLNMSYFGDVFAFLMFSGLRVGELIGMRWTDVDMKKRMIHISRTDYRGQEQPTKSASSVRDIPISEEMKKILQNHFAVGKNYVFLNTLNRKINYRSLLEAWHGYCEKAGLPDCGLHVLRHTYATNALAAGVNIKVLSELLGHKSITVTLNIYTDVGEADKAKAAELLSAYLFPEELTAVSI